MNKKSSFEGTILSVLSIMLVCVFATSVWMYDEISESTDTGVLAHLAAGVRDFIDESDAVAVFLGISDAEDKEKIAAEAAAYIERYNEIYESIE
ncbi:MAG: hypothetical protein IKU61_05835 [Clostridia bacterium]|nr:hypothetical protein [Clostridia bacterium]